MTDDEEPVSKGAPAELLEASSLHHGAQFGTLKAHFPVTQLRMDGLRAEKTHSCFFHNVCRRVYSSIYRVLTG